MIPETKPEPNEGRIPEPPTAKMRMPPRTPMMAPMNSRIARIVIPVGLGWFLHHRVKTPAKLDRGVPAYPEMK
jgi:hypothetical protein